MYGSNTRDHCMRISVCVWACDQERGESLHVVAMCVHVTILATAILKTWSFMDAYWTSDLVIIEYPASYI